MMTPSMDIYSKPGTRIRFKDNGGYREQRESALQILSYDEVYTVARIDVYSSSSFVVLNEIPLRSFNTTMFEEVENGNSPN